jgi:cytochrome c-type biogenesis protein CcmH
MRLLLLLVLLVVGRVSFAADPVSSDPVVPESDEIPSAEEIAAAPSLTEPPLLDPPNPEDLEAQTEKIAKGLRCVVCQGLSVADSNAEVARAMHARVRELVAKGYSEEQIVGYFVDRYGEWVQLEPPREGLNWIIWLGPAVLMVVGAWSISRQVNAKGGPIAPSPLSAPADGPASPKAPQPSKAPTDDYRDRILAELGDRERE